ncbi:LapA family protein, partial [Priestia flexa]
LYKRKNKKTENSVKIYATLVKGSIKFNFAPLSIFRKDVHLMKGQSFFILGLIFALIIAILAVINNEPVQFNYVFGSQDWPLILIILTSAVFGGVVAASLSFVKITQLKSKNKQQTKRIAELETQLATHSEPQADLEKPLSTQGEPSA